jgi:hypothetical protein
VHQSLASGKVQLVLDEASGLRGVLGEDEIEGLAGTPRARTEDEIERAQPCREMFADAACGLTAAPAQRSLVILDILLPARFCVAQQVQRVHDRPPHRPANGSSGPFSIDYRRSELPNADRRVIAVACNALLD